MIGRLVTRSVFSVGRVRGYAGRLVGERMKTLRIPNPNGYEANQVELFSKHDSDQMIPRPMLHENDEYQTDVKVFYPQNTLVGVDIYYAPISTLGQLHASDPEISGYQMISYALYNDRLYQLSEMEPNSEESNSIDHKMYGKANSADGEKKSFRHLNDHIPYII